MLHNLQLFTEHSWKSLKHVLLTRLNVANVCSEHAWAIGDSNISKRIQRTRLEIFKRDQVTHVCMYSGPSVFRERAWVVSMHVKWDICESWSILPDGY
jgi:hypothetical protein